LFNSRFNQRCRHGARPDLEFAALDDTPGRLAAISKTMRPGVADAMSVCFRGIPAARRSSREGRIRLEASSAMVV
jgi:hypothetical protein